MNKKIKTFLLPLLLLAFMAISQVTLASDPPPPPPGGGHGQGGNQSPLSGPITGGVAVFLAFGAGLAGWEIFKAYKRGKEETA